MRRALVSSCLLVAALIAACSENETPPSARGNYVGAPPLPLPCVPNLDGKIDFNELQPNIGVAANFLISPLGKTRTVDQIGVVRDGKTLWAFNAELPDDQLFQNRATPLEGKWYADRFPGLENPIVLPIDASGNNEGVYTHNETALFLHGLASKVEAVGTVLPYDEPIPLYQFPLAVGSSYIASADVRNGTFQTLPWAQRDTYEVKVDAAGEVLLSDLKVQQALRVKTKVTVSPAAGPVVVTRQTSFLFECVGEIVRLVGVSGEEDENFSTAAEVRRLGLSQ